MNAYAGLFERFGFAVAAEQSYRKAVAENPRKPEPMVRLMTFLSRQNRISEALEFWKEHRADLKPDLAAHVGV